MSLYYHLSDLFLPTLLDLLLFLLENAGVDNCELKTVSVADADVNAVVVEGKENTEVAWNGLLLGSWRLLKGMDCSLLTSV